MVESLAAIRVSRAFRYNMGMVEDQDPDVERVARRMIAKYGRNAAIMAEKRARELLAEGNHFAYDLWRKVVSAVQRMQDERL